MLPDLKVGTLAAMIIRFRLSISGMSNSTDDFCGFLSFSLPYNGPDVVIKTDQTCSQWSLVADTRDFCSKVSTDSRQNRVHSFIPFIIIAMSEGKVTESSYFNVCKVELLFNRVQWKFVLLLKSSMHMNYPEFGASVIKNLVSVNGRLEAFATGSCCGPYNIVLRRHVWTDISVKPFAQERCSGDTLSFPLKWRCK